MGAGSSSVKKENDHTASETPTASTQDMTLSKLTKLTLAMHEKAMISQEWTPVAGQQIVIAGTGKWWAGQELRAIVVDVRESDKSVKVQYTDGSFKRFPTDEFKVIAKKWQEPQHAGSESWTPSVGQHVYIAGIGMRWAGRHFGAVIVDIRESDDTIKVRYTDGGFKRFSMGVFRVLASRDRPPPQMWEEWDIAAPTHEEERVSELSQLHDEIVVAVKNGDNLMAAELQEAFKAKQKTADEHERLHMQLLEAVNRGDYLDAHRLQQQINKAEGKPAQTLSTPSPEITGATRSTRINEALGKGVWKGLEGGLAGAAAMSLQVLCFYWLRTAMNYQYRYGAGTLQTIRTLYAEGGAARFYRGFCPALVQGPLLRFGDTATNAGVLAVFEHMEAEQLPVFVKTAFASASAAALRVVLVPIDTVKTMLQVEGAKGFSKLAAKRRVGGARVLFHGAVASSLATLAGHYPWFVVFNGLNATLPRYQTRPMMLLRDAGIGFSASVCSDTVANGLRVLKTNRQTNEAISYRGIVRNVVAKDGYTGLLGRGLKTRIIANGCQGIMFSVLYRLFEERLMRT